MGWLTQILLLLAAGAVGVLLSPSEDAFKEWILGRGGELAGDWREELQPAYHRPYKRVDDLKVRHNKRSGRVRVRVTRVEPSDETGRRWKMSGFIRGDELVLNFWPIGKVYDGSSYGVIILHRDSSSAEVKWCGAYVRPGTDIGRSAGKSNFEQIGMTWFRI
jgi:hypothetical protein